MAEQEYTVQDVFGRPISFWGEILSDVRHHNRPGVSPQWRRWTDMVLYRVTERGSRFRYAIEVVGRSVVYHKSGTTCRERKKSPWARIAVEDLYKSDRDRYDELLPCTEQGCRPGDLDDLRADEIILVESNDTKILKAKTADETIRHLYAEYGKISVIAQKMLIEAAVKDPDIARTLKRPGRIGS